MTIQEIMQEIKIIADNNSFVNFSYIGDVEEMKLQPGFSYPGFSIENISYEEDTKTYNIVMYLISEIRSQENDCLNVLKDIVYNVNTKHIDLGIVVKSNNIQIIQTGKLNGAYCSMKLQMAGTGCVCEDKPGYVSSVNGQTGDVIIDIPDIERTVIDVNGQVGHVVLDIPEKLSDLYQDIEYATPAYVDEKAEIEHNYTDSVKSDLEDEIGKLVTGVSSVNGSTGDVVIFIPKLTSDLENDSDFIDSEYVDNLIDLLNSSINTNYAKKSELSTAIANEVSRADNAYAKKTDIPTNVYTKQEVDDKDKNIIANTSLNFATKTQLNTAISDEVSRADNKYANKTDIPTDFYTKKEVNDKVSAKQDVLVSGTNIKTINGKDILGSGDVTIEAGTDEAKVKEIISSEMFTTYLPGIENSVENADKEIIANASINYLLKTDYIVPDVDKEYVDTEIGKLVTGVSSVNGQKGDVIIETADTKYVDNKFDTLNSSVNANFQVKGDYATNERVDNVEALIPTDVVKHAEIADFVTNSSISANYYKKSEVDNKIETLDSSVAEHYVKKGEVPLDVYSKDLVDALFTEYDETVDSTYEKKGHYNNKISEIDSSIGDISTRLAGIKIPTDYVKTADYSADKEAQANKDSEQDSNIATANLNISLVDAKVEQVKKTTTEQIGSLTGQINGVSGRVKTIEDDYVKHEEISDFVTNSSVSVNYATKSELDELKLFKFPNVTIIGEPTINNGQISDFSVNDYLEFPFLVNFRDRAFEINFDIKTGSNVTAQENILDSDYGLAFAIRNSRFVMAVSTNGTTWNLGETIGTHVILPNTSYRVKISYDRLRYKIEYSTDGGQTYIEDAVKTAASLSPFPKQMYIGVGEVNATVKNVFSGIINLNYANLLINGELVWQGMDDVGLATRLAVDMSNIDPAGEQKVKDIIATEGYIKEIPENDYATRDELNSSLANVSSWVNSNFARKSSLDGFITEADANNKYYGKADGLALHKYIHEELDSEITDLYKKDQEIDSSISDVSSRIKNVKDTVDSLDEVYVSQETYNTDLAEQEIVNAGVNEKLGKINTSIGTLNSSVNAIENAGYLDAADKAELEGKINSKQDAGDYATNARVDEVEGKIPEVKDFVTNSSISTNYYNKTEIDNKGYLNKVTADGYYQEKGNYLTSSDKSELEDKINAKADNSTVTGLESRVSANETDITDIKSDIQTLDRKIPTDYVSNSSLSTNYYKKTEVYNKEETEGFIGGLRTEFTDALENKQDKLVSGNNIKTINNESILGSGNIEVKGEEHVSLTYEEWEALTPELKEADIVYLIKDAENVYATPEQVQAVQNSVDNLTGRVSANETDIAEIKNAGYVNISLVEEKIESYNYADEAYVQTQIDELNIDSYLKATDAAETYQIKGNYVDSDIYNVKVSDIDSSISDVSSRVKTNYDDITNIIGTVNSLNSRVSTNSLNNLEQDSSIRTLNSSVNAIEADYVKHEELPVIPDYSDKFAEIDSSIGDVSARVKSNADKNNTQDSSINRLDSSVNTLESDILTKQEILVSGTNIKKINGEDILGEGNIEITGFSYLNQETLVNTYVGKQAADFDGDSALIIDLPGDERVSIHTNNIEISSNEYRNVVQFYGLNFEYYDSDNGLQGQIYYSNIATKTEVSAKQDTLVSGRNIKTINGQTVLGSGNIEIKGGGLEYLTPGTIVKTEGGMLLEFIADLTTTEANRARGIQIIEGAEYYYELISGYGHIIYTANGDEGAFLLSSQVFSWDYGSINTRNGYEDDDGSYSDIWQRATGSVGKLYRYLGQEEDQEIPLSDYIDSKIDSKIGDINTILESI